MKTWLMKTWLPILIGAIIVISIAGIIWSQWRLKQYSKPLNSKEDVEQNKPSE